MRYSIKLSYDGSAFNGWQIQPNAPSVQQTLENALSRFLGGSIQVTGAGRTDTGVHAIGYVAHFECPDETTLTADEIRYKLNAILPSQICVHEVCRQDSTFHARFDAKKRGYVYFLHKGKDPFIGKRSWQCGFDLDVDKMNEAAASMLGTHDFSCFEKVGADNKTSICTVTRAEWEEYTPDHVRMMGFPAQKNGYLVFHIEADRFLRNMVRATVGTLVEVGRGRRSVEDFRELILDASAGAEKSGTPARCRAGESVPGHALFLCKVDYE